MIGSTLPSRSLLACFAATLLVPFSWAGEGCHRCGCKSPCRKVVQWVQVERKLTTTCWGLKEEEFCIGAPSCLQCEQGESVCQDDCEEPTADSGPRVKTGASYWAWKIWQPASTAKVHMRQKLMKKTITKTVPSFRWIVVDLCEACRNKPQDELPKQMDRDSKAER